jgi:hypothetical protein
MSNMVERLRDWRSVHLARLHLLMEEAADEMERVRAVADRRGELAVERRREIERLRLTDAERQAIMLAATCSEHGILPSTVAAGDRLAATLRSLLDRLGGER